jgi:hypothetical protein
MRDLITQRESALIERFDYRFEADDSDDKAIEFPSIQIGYRNDGFRKLSGEARKFLLLKPEVDLSFIKRKLAKIPSAPGTVSTAKRLTRYINKPWHCC